MRVGSEILYDVKSYPHKYQKSVVWWTTLLYNNFRSKPKLLGRLISSPADSVVKVRMLTGLARNR